MKLARYSNLFGTFLGTIAPSAPIKSGFGAGDRTSLEPIKVYHSRISATA